MDTLCVGHPVFELAFMWLAFVGFGELDPAVCSNFFKLPAELLERFWGKTLRLYLGSEDESYVCAVEDKAKLIGYTRLMRRTLKRKGMETDFGRATIERCQARIAELLECVDSLDF